MIQQVTYRETLTMYLCILLLSCCFFTAMAIDKSKLATCPKPASNFDLRSWSSGRWYTQARYVPCSFAGSKKFSDMQLDAELDGHLVKQTFTHRSEDICVTVTFLLSVLDHGNGNFIQKDSVGGMMTGNQVVVVYNIKKGYDISWGCTKKSVDGDCSDPFVLVKTREKYPGRYVWICIVRDLKRLFDMTPDDMVIVSHKNRKYYNHRTNSNC